MKKSFHGISDHLRINRTLKAINFADQDLHVYESLDGADDGGDDPHGLVRGDGDAVNVTWGQIIVLESLVKITEFSNNYMFTGFSGFLEQMLTWYGFHRKHKKVLGKYSLFTKIK